MRKLQSLQFVLVAIVLITSIGCTTMEPLSSTRPAAINSSIFIGNKVEILCASGDRVVMQVKEKTAKGLRGDGQFVAYTDMVSIKVRRIDNEKTEQAFRVASGVLLVGAFLYALPGYAAAAALGGT